jgi:hypothetical protein
MFVSACGVLGIPRGLERDAITSTRAAAVLVVTTFMTYLFFYFLLCYLNPAVGIYSVSSLPLYVYSTTPVHALVGGGFGLVVWRACTDRSYLYDITTRFGDVMAFS